MKQFIAVVHKDADSAYGVHFPDIPGCYSAADEQDDLLKNAVEALSLYFEDEDMIEPRDMEAIHEAAAQDIVEGAFLMAVPYIGRSARSVRVNFSIDQGTLEAIDSAADMLNLSRSAFLAQAAKNEIEGRH